MRKVLIMALLTLAGWQAHADDYAYLTFQKTDGTATSLTAAGLTMTFSGSQVTVTSGDEMATFEVSELGKMFFGNEKIETGIDLSELSGTLALVTVYTAAGVFVGTFAADVDWQSRLSSGMYIVKGKDSVRKVVVR